MTILLPTKAGMNRTLLVTSLGEKAQKRVIKCRNEGTMQPGAKWHPCLATPSKTRRAPDPLRFSKLLEVLGNKFSLI